MPIWASIHCVTSSFIICQLSLTKNMTKEFKIRHCLQHSWAVVCWAGPRAGNKPSQSFHNHREGPFSIVSRFLFVKAIVGASSRNFKLREGSFPTLLGGDWFWWMLKVVIISSSSRAHYHLSPCNHSVCPPASVLALVPQINPLVPQPVVQSRRRP